MTITKQVWLCRWSGGYLEKGSETPFIIDRDPKTCYGSEKMIVMGTTSVSFEIPDDRCPHCYGDLKAV